ncbi:MAG: hypothetical protein QOC81_4065 [Thermoanaerobaculia bacterium]|jgi:hypothetical protein|nr:hypothetical protein [Thermoanaerobaculia bacterium]
MSLIDWSDPDEMLGLLADFVADEASTSYADRERARFLGTLSRALGDLAEQESGGGRQVAEALRQIRTSQPDGFLSDPVIEHLDACIEELCRIESAQHGMSR